MANHEKIPADPSNCAGVLKVLADQTRLAVVEQLLDGPKHVGEINQALNVEQTLLSHHLKVLREAEIVTSQREGKQVLYSLAKSVQSKWSGKAIDLGCCKITFD